MANNESLDEQQKKQQCKKDNLESVVVCSATKQTDGVSLHQFPADENVRRQWPAFFTIQQRTE